MNRKFRHSYSVIAIKTTSQKRLTFYLQLTAIMFVVSNGIIFVDISDRTLKYVEDLCQASPFKEVFKEAEWKEIFHAFAPSFNEAIEMIKGQCVEMYGK